MTDTAEQASLNLTDLIRMLEFFHQSVALIPMAITITKFDDGRCAYVSPTFADLLGHDVKVFRDNGMNWFVNHLHVEDRISFKINFAEGFLFILNLPTDQKLKSYFNLTARFMHKNGEKRWIYYQCRPVSLDIEGKPAYSLNIISDITHLMGSADVQPCWSVVEKRDGLKPLLLGGSCYDSMHWLFGSVSSPLTKKETAILKDCMLGTSGKQLASKHRVSINTVNTHRKNIIRKCRAGNMNQAIELALKNDWIHEQHI